VLQECRTRRFNRGQRFPAAPPSHYEERKLSKGLPPSCVVLCRGRDAGQCHIRGQIAGYCAPIAHETGNGVEMKDASAATAKNTAKNTTKNTTQNKHMLRKSVDENTALHRRYGQIGISAVAAAVRYQGSRKNAAYAPAASKRQDHATA
jgi:hypothetical protein